MAKNLLSGISLEDIDLEAHVASLGEVLKREGPRAHKAFHSVEGDVERAGRLLYDTFAGEDESDESPDLLAKLFNG